MPSRTIAHIVKPTGRNLARLATRLRAGELVAVPTETVYGLAANAWSAKACKKIFLAKGRPSTDPLIVHLFSAQQLAQVALPNAAAEKLAQAFWPGPLTLVLPKLPTIPDVVTGGRDSVAVRVPAHPVLRRLLKLTALPLAAPSANPFGYVSPTTAQHVVDGLGGRIRWVLDGGPSRHGVESTIVDLRHPRRPRLLRPGAITRMELEKVLQQRVAARKMRSKTGAAQIAPGMLARHYSPRTPVILHGRLSVFRAKRNPNHAFVFQGKPRGRTPQNVYWFDVKGSPRGVARRLFAVLRALDRAGYAVLHVEQAPGAGLADTINDRLRRAAAR